MILNNVPQVKITSNNSNQNSYSVVPNFLMINQPEVKALETKVKRNKRLIVWFDLRNESDRNNSMTSQSIELNKFSFQLMLKTKKGNKQLKSLNKKDPAEFDKWTIKKDIDGVVIDENNILVYELNDDVVSSETTFEYILSYQNTQKLGLTFNGVDGSNRGSIVINDNEQLTNNQFVFNNAFAYLENNLNKVNVISSDRLVIKNNKVNAIQSLNKPILEIFSDHQEKSLEGLAKSQQIRAELGRISNNGISYLQSDENTLKTTKNGNVYKVYKTTGNHYDFQTDKWVNSEQDDTYTFVENNTKLSFEYNYQKFSVDLLTNNKTVKIINNKSSNKTLSLVSTYKNTKPNTKFNTFIKSRTS